MNFLKKNLKKICSVCEFISTINGCNTLELALHITNCEVCSFVYLYFCICMFDTCDYNFWYPWTILFSKIYHMLGLSGNSSYAVFVYLCIYVFVYLYLRFWHMGIPLLTSLHNPLFINIYHVGSFWHLVICCICVCVYLCLCVFVYLCVYRTELE